MAVRTRHDAWKLSHWDPILLWYARAVREMQARPITDPTSWRYQAAIHDYVPGNVPGGDPFATPGEPLPSQADRTRFWRQCQHFSWFFLPWHRMYLFYFEQIVANTIVQLGGPDGWALPYWNYSDSTNPDSRKIPSAFRDATLPDGTPNALRITQRASGNNGDDVGFSEDVDLLECLQEPQFVAQAPGGSPGFGGAETGFSHTGTFAAMGQLERLPHGSMHGQVGGFMGRFHTAALDPLFWLHHANIDRLWEVWRRRNNSHTNPTQAEWLTGVPFDFNDGLGTVVTHTSNQVVDTETVPLEYVYEDTSDPFPFEAAVLPMTRRPAEMIGASEQPVTLTGRPAVAELAVTAPTGPGRAAEAAGDARMYLNLENITGTGDPVSYAVYLNVPEGARPEDHPERFAGVLPMFGVAEASQADDRHPGSGLHYALEVGRIVRELAARGEWNPARVRVTFVPRTTSALEAAAERPIRVGRVSVYVG
jgi:tyrosinase